MHAIVARPMDAKLCSSSCHCCCLLTHFTTHGVWTATYNSSTWLTCRYEQLVTLFPGNEDYKLYYAQSLYKAGMYVEASKAAIKVCVSVGIHAPALWKLVGDAGTMSLRDCLHKQAGARNTTERDFAIGIARKGHGVRALYDISIHLDVGMHGYSRMASGPMPASANVCSAGGGQEQGSHHAADCQQL